MEADPLGAESKRQMFDKGIAAIDSLLESRGVDRFYGRVLYSKLNSFGLTRVKANGRSVTLHGGPNQKRWLLQWSSCRFRRSVTA